METIIWTLVSVPVSALFTGLGIFAWNRKKPMWFWSGSEVREEEIADIPAYNRANGIMWLVFSVFLWISAILGMCHQMTAGLILEVVCFAGLPILALVYRKIYAKYKK